MSNHSTASDAQGRALLEEMEKTIPQKTAVCAAHMILDDGAVVLDAGCADGVATAYFALTNPSIHVIGIDYDAVFIDKAKAKYGHIPNLEFIVEDLRSFDLGEAKLDAIINLSILHEPFSYTGYRKRTIKEIIQAELSNLKPGGVIINRDFVLPDFPEKMVYLAVEDSGDAGNTLGDMSYSQLLKLYAKEAMAFDNNDPEGHIKGFFLEEHTPRIDLTPCGIPDNWRVFYLPHGFAWEFIWRKEYRDRFYPEANEKYAFWNRNEHRYIPQALGARVTYHAHYENPWIVKNWYQSKVALFDENMKRLPLPPSNFLSVLQKIRSKDSIYFREHRTLDTKPSYLQLASFRHTETSDLYDLVSRPGGDVVDVLPYSFCIDGKLTIYAKYNYPRPLVNTVPRMMTANLDSKTWSGHIIEALATAGGELSWEESVHNVLVGRSGFDENEIADGRFIETGLCYYTSPSELNERVTSAYVEIKKGAARERKLNTHFSGFSSDGSIRSFDANSLLDSAQVGVLPEARLELNIYQLFFRLRLVPNAWIGEEFIRCDTLQVGVRVFADALEDVRKHRVFEQQDEPCGWLDIVRSEFHEITVDAERERASSRRELEFVVPNPKNSKGLSTNCVSCLVVAEHRESKEHIVAFSKISGIHSQYAAVQEREKYSGLLHIPKHRLPSDVDHIQQLPLWIAERYHVPLEKISKLGESYFPSLGVMPDRVFPFLIQASSDTVEQHCDFYSLKEVFQNLDSLQDMHAIVAVNRVVHALGLWEEYLV